ncbi:g9056 [Coccomyxa elongata]
MENCGRIQCALIATTSSHVIYERFYDRFSDIEKAEIRSAFHSAQRELSQDKQETVGRLRCGAHVARAEGELVYHALGTGEYDELALAETLRFIAVALHDVLRKTPSEALLLDNYARMCIILSEIINEGILEITDRATLLRALKIKGFE